MASVFLIGGGWQQPEETFGRFVREATVVGRTRIVLILREEDDVDPEEVFLKYCDIFACLGIKQQQLEVIWVSENKPLQIEELNLLAPTGVLVGGGTTPLYREVLCRDRSLAEYVRERKIPYGGFSAGAAIAAEKAVVGGWKIHLDAQDVAIVDEECSEGVEWLQVSEGLGLIPFSVDVHATQWGNLARMIHAVEQQQVEVGWAIDEDTMIQVTDQSIQIWGSGQVYRVQRASEGAVHLDIFRAGDQCSFQR